MRQLVGFLAAVHKANAISFYEQTLSYASIHGTKLPSLQEFLGVSLGDKEAAFDEKTDAYLEKIALQKLSKGRHG